MFRFRDPKQPPAPPAGRAKRCVGACARGALLGAAAAAKASADALRWAAERRPAPPHPPKIEPIPVVVVSPPPPGMAARRTLPPQPPKSSSKVLPILAVVLVFGVVFSAAGLKETRRGPAAPPEPRKMASLSPAKLTGYAADNGVLGGAKAALAALEQQAKAKLVQLPQPVPSVVQLPPVPAVPPEPPGPPHEGSARMAFHLTPEPAARPKTAVKLTTVKSLAPHTTREAALEDALKVAQERLGDQLARLDPPLHLAPSLKEVRGYLKEDTVAEVRPTAEDREAWQRQGIESDRFWVTADFEVTDAQVRQLRGGGRLASVVPLAVLAMALSGGMYGFLRLDAATRGHLTGVLLLGYGLVLAGAVALAAMTGPW